MGTEAVTSHGLDGRGPEDGAPERSLDMPDLSQIANTYQSTMEPMRGRRNIAILSPDSISGGGGWAPSEKP